MSIQKFKAYRGWSFMEGSTRWLLSIYNGHNKNTYVIMVSARTEQGSKDTRATIHSYREPSAKRIVDEVKERIPEFPVPDALMAESSSTFLDDPDKMKDLLILSKEEFLKSYSYMSEEEYDETMRVYQIIVDAQEWALKHKN